LLVSLNITAATLQFVTQTLGLIRASAAGQTEFLKPPA
jgi:hypothetical protein